ncbi:MAG: hypothetical protein Q9183_000876 [Haloplaca sp. 2 TL-2023]
MSGHANFDESASSRTHTAPYSSHHPVPTVQGYQETRQDRQEHTTHAQQDQDATSAGRNGDPLEFAEEHLLRRNRGTGDQKSNCGPYPSQNRYGADVAKDARESSSETSHLDWSQNAEDTDGENANKDRSGSISASNSPHEKRKNMKSLKRDAQGRQVTDPVTHLPVHIHDSTTSELRSAPENESHATLMQSGKEGERSSREAIHQQAAHQSMKAVFPPPDLQNSGQRFAVILQSALTAGLSLLLAALLVGLLSFHLYHAYQLSRQSSGTSNGWPYLLVTSLSVLVFELSAGVLVIWGLRRWVEKKVFTVWEDGIWEAARAREQDSSQSPIPESVQWMNCFLASVWPLINPDLFTSLADTLEDVMQASLPKMVRMISVEDLGQGNEALRVLGIKWLPVGNAKKDISVDGRVQNRSNTRQSDRKVLNEGESSGDLGPYEAEKKEEGGRDSGAESIPAQSNEGQAVAEGMEAEEGDFVNMELGLSYRASTTGKSMKVKAKNAHLYLVFYLPGGIRFRMVGTMRMRLQLCPDPPFVALCTLTFLGQPKVDLSCVPLTRKGLNIMDLPLVSSFVQSSIDAALAEYVAPKSLTLDLKDMLIGDDFKKDTSARGVLAVRIASASGFKEGDQSLGGLKQGSSKQSSPICICMQHSKLGEGPFALVLPSASNTPDPCNLQSDAYVAVGWAKFGKPVWSTRTIKADMEPTWNETAFILVGPEELNAGERLRLGLWDSDRTSADDDLGRIETDLKELMSDSRSLSKMWEREDGLRALDPDEIMPGKLKWSVGYFPKERIRPEQLEQQSLEPDIKTLQQLKTRVSEDVGNKMREASNHGEAPELDQQKAQDLKIREDSMIASTSPSFNSPSGILSVQIHQISGLELEKVNKQEDEGVTESDDAEGQKDDLPSSYCTVILNHQKIFQTRTKPKNSQPFFNAGTERFVRDWRNTEVILYVRDARVHENDPLLRTSINRGKMYPADAADGIIRWAGKKDRYIRLPVQRRYSSCVVVEFRKNRLGLDQTPAFAILWLQDISDEQYSEVSLPIFGGGKSSLKRAELNCDCNLGERLGSITINVKFRRGMSRYHHRLGSNNPGVQDVLEVLSTAHNSKEVKMAMAEDETEDGSDSSSSSSESDLDSGEAPGFRREFKASLTGKNISTGDGGEDSGGGPLKQFREYTDHSDQLHRHHRGLMQWKGARTAKWMKTKVTDGKDRIAESLKHHDRTPDVETEV